MQHREALFRVEVLRRNGFASSVLTCDPRWAFINEIQLTAIITTNAPLNLLAVRSIYCREWIIQHFLVLQVALQVSI
jgi:hypothetical protein